MTNTNSTRTARADRPNSAMRRRIRAAIIAYHGTTCAVVGCGRETIVDGAPTDGRTFNLGHVIADANGGTWKTENLLPICRRCNSELGDRDWPVTMMARRPVALDLPRDPGTAERHMEPGPFSAR